MTCQHPSLQVNEQGICCDCGRAARLAAITTPPRVEIDRSTTVYDYDLQVWTVNGIVQPCGHPIEMRVNGPCCPANRYRGRHINTIPQKG